MKKNKITAILFTHANMDTPVPIFADRFFTCFRSTADKFTYVMGTGGALVPVKEPWEEVLRKVESALNATNVASDSNESSNPQTKESP